MPVAISLGVIFGSMLTGSPLVFLQQMIFHGYTDKVSWKRLLFAGMFCLVLLLAVTSDYGSRWSGEVSKWPNAENKEHRPWLPDDGGIVYNDNMFLFYQVFYNNLKSTWRYTLGFEPIWMTADNLKIYRQIQLTRGKDESYMPWVKKMNAKDRMILIRNGKPQIEGLEWHEVTPTIWSGKITQKNGENNKKIINNKI